ncbi:unnamed protein product [Calypogeia fissa]
MAASGVRFDEDTFINKRGMRLNTCQWIPIEKEVKGLVFLCHGYGQECTIYTQEAGQRLARAGYGVYGIDYEGHGKSEGLRGFVPNFNELVADCATHFASVMDREENLGKARFLLGESMGGAVSLLISRRNQARFRGLVLLAPMLKISEKVMPPKFLVSTFIGLFIQLGKVIPKWKVVPTQDLFRKAFKDPIKLEKIQSNPYIYRGNHRVKTAIELLLTTRFIRKHLSEVSSPFLCVHGMDDAVNDPKASEELYDSASTPDKTLKLYPGMWHGLTTAEPDHNVDMVFEDIIKWLDKRAGAEACSPTLQGNSIGTFFEDSLQEAC